MLSECVTFQAVQLHNLRCGWRTCLHWTCCITVRWIQTVHQHPGSSTMRSCTYTCMIINTVHELHCRLCPQTLKQQHAQQLTLNAQQQHSFCSCIHKRRCFSCPCRCNIIARCCIGSTTVPFCSNRLLHFPPCSCMLHCRSQHGDRHMTQPLHAQAVPVRQVIGCSL